MARLDAAHRSGSAAGLPQRSGGKTVRWSALLDGMCLTPLRPK
ncbi:MAG: hypothetical protein P0111_01195 [Nitrospira sp.]|nr:hypothetical protein [Nitrospira sp.]